MFPQQSEVCKRQYSLCYSHVFLRCRLLMHPVLFSDYQLNTVIHFGFHCVINLRWSEWKGLNHLKHLVPGSILGEVCIEKTQLGGVPTSRA